MRGVTNLQLSVRGRAALRRLAVPKVRGVRIAALVGLVALGALLLSSQPAEAQTSGTLVSNSGQTDVGSSTSLRTFEMAQAFRSGSN